MRNFREFKENIVSSIQKKIAEKLESKKIEMAREMFGEGIEITESAEDAKKSKEKQSLIDKWVKKGKNRAEATKKVESLYDYVKRVYPDAPPAKMIEIMWTVDEDVSEVDEGWSRPEGKLAGWIAIFQGKKIEIRKEKDAKDIWSAKEFAIKALRVPKSKQGLLAIQPAYEEDMKESTDISEGMGAFKAAAEVLKVFGGKKPNKPSDLMKFDSELEKASKKYDVSVDDILKVINK